MGGSEKDLSAPAASIKVPDSALALLVPLISKRADVVSEVKSLNTQIQLVVDAISCSLGVPAGWRLRMDQGCFVPPDVSEVSDGG
jgi:hypothetical protein